MSALHPTAAEERTSQIVRLVPISNIASPYSNAKMRFQSFFMLMTGQPLLFASSYSACVKAPDQLAGSINGRHLKDRLRDVETDCRNPLHG